MSNIIVTGGFGYVGSLVVEKLYNDGILPHVIDKGFFGIDSVYKSMYQNYFKSFTEYKEKCNFCEGDTIIHLGGLSNDPMADYSKEANTRFNTNFTNDIASLFGESGGKRFIYASTASVYGFNDNKVTEETKVNPNSAYAKSKYAAEQILQELSKKHGFELIIIRKATCMGLSPRPRFDLVVNTMLANAYKHDKIYLHAGGETWRPLVHVADAAECYKYFALSEKEFNEPMTFNLVHKNYRVSELGLYIKAMLKRQFDKDVEIISDYDVGECRSYMMDGTKLKDFGFETKIGVLKTIGEIWNVLQGGINPDDPINRNIDWLLNCERVCKCMGHKFDLLEQY